jgi:hypothetical protein
MSISFSTFIFTLGYNPPHDNGPGDEDLKMNVIKENGNVCFVGIQVADGVAFIFEAGRVVAWQVVDEKAECTGIGGLPCSSYRLVGIGVDMQLFSNLIGYLFRDTGEVEMPDFIRFGSFDEAQKYAAENNEYFVKYYHEN